MNKGWLQKVIFGMMVVYALGTVACGSNSDFDNNDNEDAIENIGNGNGNGNQNNDEGVVFFDGGSITTSGGGISASFDDGTGIAFDGGGEI